MTEQTTNLTAEQLRAELARIEEAQNAELSRQADVLKARQNEYDEHVLATWRQQEQEAKDAGAEARKAAAQALYEGDLNAAFRLYSTWHFTRTTRDRIHSLATNAANRLGTTIEGAHDLRYVEFDFINFMQSEGGKASERHGNEEFEKIYGESPATYADVAATDPDAPAEVLAEIEQGEEG